MVVLSSETLHATTVSIGGHAVMLCGPSGIGKSDLGLRLIDRGAKLVSDDYTLVKRSGDRLLAEAPANIAGKIEVRGLGIVPMDYVSGVEVAMLVNLFDVVERMPLETADRLIAGVPIPVTKIVPLEISAPVKIELMLKQVLDKRKGSQS